MLKTLFAQQRPLMVGGVVSFALFLVFTTFALVDPTDILGVNRWIKPVKFFISIAIYLWTIALYFHYLRGHEKLKGRMSWAILVIFMLEMAVITGQSLRGTTSHFNTATPFDGILYAVMGISIFVNTLLVAYVTYLYFRSDVDLPSSIAWGMRLGLIVFLLGSAQGGYMSAQIGHTVGAADGGAGLPLVNWSTAAGDLRVAHFLGLHSLQAVPLFAILAERLQFSARTAMTAAFAAAYFALFALLFIQALIGRPLLALM